MLCIDANVWIYYLDETTPEHSRVREPMRTALRERTLFANAVIPLEVTHHLQNHLQDGPERVSRLLALDGFEVEPLDTAMVERANEFLAAYPAVGIGGRDAALLAAMDRRGVRELWTHDDGLKRLGSRLDWLNVGDPAV